MQKRSSIFTGLTVISIFDRVIDHYSSLSPHEKKNESGPEKKTLILSRAGLLYLIYLSTFSNEKLKTIGLSRSEI